MKGIVTTPRGAAGQGIHALAAITAPGGINIDGMHLHKGLLERLIQVEKFVDYLTEAHPEIGELWTAFSAAERMDK